MSGERTEMHLSADIIASYVDGRLPAAEQASVEDHLAACAECRREVVGVTRLVRFAPRRRRWTVLAPLAAAAAVLVLYVAPWQSRHDSTKPPLREPAVTTTTAPSPSTPRGEVSVLRMLPW